MKASIVFVLVISAAGGVVNAADTTWETSEENGCKPGIGFRLVQGAKGFTGTMYILDPNHPHDFSKGETCKMKVTRSDAREITFQIDLGDNKPRNCKFKFDAPLESKPVHGTLTEENSKGVPQVYTFKPVKPK